MLLYSISVQAEKHVKRKSILYGGIVMKEVMKKYLTTLGLDAERMERFGEIFSAQVIATADMMMCDSPEDYIERGEQRVKALGDYEIIQISLNRAVTIFFLYKEGESEALAPGECLVYVYNNDFEEYSDAGVLPVEVIGGLFIKVREE